MDELEQYSRMNDVAITGIKIKLCLYARQRGAQRAGDALSGATGGILTPKQADRDGPGAHRGVSPTAHEEQETTSHYDKICQPEK